MTLPDEIRLADEQVDAGRGDVERERLAVLVVVVDPVALDEADRPALMADEEEARLIRIIAADPPPVLVELVVGIRRARRIGPPAAHVRLEEPSPHEWEVRFGQRREVVLRRIR